MTAASDDEIYDDDFELSPTDTPQDNKLNPPKSSSVPKFPPAGVQSTGKRAMGSPQASKSGSKTKPPSNTSLPQLIRPPESRAAAAKQAANSEGSNVMHLSKLTTVTQIDSDSGKVKSNVRDSVDSEDRDTAGKASSRFSHELDDAPVYPTEARSSTVHATSSREKSVSSHNSSINRHRDLYPAAAEGPAAAHATESEPKKERHASVKEADSRMASHGRYPGSRTSSEGGSSNRPVDVWKTHETTPRETAKNSKSYGSAFEKGGKRQNNHSERTTLPPVSYTSQSTSKEVLWQRSERTHSTSNSRSLERPHTLSPDVPPARNVKKDAMRSQSERILPPLVSAKKHEYLELRPKKRVPRGLSRGRPANGQRGKSRLARMDLDKLERENEYLQRLIDLRTTWAGSIDLPLRVAEEELKYVLDELERLKRKRRDLWTENRRISIVLTQVVRDDQPVPQKVARQYREGMYNRLTLQNKVEALQEKIASTQETSDRLTKQISQLEQSMEADGLTQMKPEEYTAMHDAVEKNTTKISKLTSAIAALTQKTSYNTFSSGRSPIDGSHNVAFPGRPQMEALVLKLIKQVEQKEAQINSLRQRFSQTGSTVPKGKGSLSKIVSRKQSLSLQRKASGLSRTPSLKSSNKTDASQIAALKKRTSILQSKPKIDGEGGGPNDMMSLRSSDGKRVVTSKFPTSSLLKLERTTSDLSDSHKTGVVLFPASESSMASSPHLETPPKRTRDDAKKTPVLDADVKTNTSALHNPSSERGGSAAPMHDSQPNYTPMSLVKPESSQITVNDDVSRSEVAESVGDEVVDAAQEAVESGRKTPLWLQEY